VLAVSGSSSALDSLGLRNLIDFRKLDDYFAVTADCTFAVSSIFRPLPRRYSLETNMKTMLKTIFSVALVLGFCGLAGAADEKSEKADPVGTWKCEYQIGDAKRTSTLTIKKDGDKLDGTMSWPDQKEAKLKDLKLKDATLTFSAVRKFMDLEIPVDYTLTIDGDKLKGKGASDRQGEKYEWDITAKREKPAEKKAEEKKDK
jgi:hypothetical protein